MELKIRIWNKSFSETQINISLKTDQFIWERERIDRSVGCKSRVQIVDN